MTVGEVLQGTLYTCSPDDDVEAVLEVMKEHAIRRVPVEGFGGTVLGIVSMNDIVLGWPVRDEAAVRGVEVVETLQSICAHHQPGASHRRCMNTAPAATGWPRARFH